MPAAVRDVLSATCRFAIIVWTLASIAPGERRRDDDAGALRADLTVAQEMDDACVYERTCHNPELRALIGGFYAAIDMRSTDRRFQGEIASELVHALSG